MASSSSLITNPDTNTNPSRKKRRKIGPPEVDRKNLPGETRWRSEKEQQVYSSKLVDALRQIRRPATTGAAASGRVVRDAADQVLAVSAKGQTRWSRAMLTGRLSRRLADINRKHKKAAKPVEGSSRLKKPTAKNKMPPLQRKVRVLGRLVPGCRKLSLPSLLEETTDYIAALEMQVKAMTFITALLNGGAATIGDSNGGSSSESNRVGSSTQLQPDH